MREEVGDQRRDYASFPSLLVGAQTRWPNQRQRPSLFDERGVQVAQHRVQPGYL
jgi:hypothetical protein